MSSIKEAFREFLDSGVDPFGAATRKLDSETIATVHDSAMSMAARTGALRKWWHDYSVARNLRSGEHEPVASAFIRHFDARRLEAAGQAFDVVSEFEVLSELAKEHRSAEFRDRCLISLCSKSLWLFYPEDTPMYDGYAATALRVLSRLYRFPVDRNTKPFAQFVQAWNQGFLHVAPLIPAHNPTAYRVRVFDAFLWWLGQGTFESLEN